MSTVGIGSSRNYVVVDNPTSKFSDPAFVEMARKVGYKRACRWRRQETAKQRKVVSDERRHVRSRPMKFWGHT